jgi:putative phage-type endonuclease
MLLSDLDDLEDMIDSIDDCTNDSNGNNYSMTEDETLEIVDECLQLLENYISENPKEISEEDYEETIRDYLFDYLLIILENHILARPSLKTDLEELVEHIIELFHIQIIPPRSYPNTFITTRITPISEITDQINYLNKIPQPQQRTQEWYEFRHKLITASNAYKVFESDCTQNQLIYEKCQPLKIVSSEPIHSKCVNVDSPLHWGQKYEPISVMYYENMYNTTIGDFGCIQHSKYTFLGASPDGINIDSTNPRYGRMLEIKNIVNREITGIPKKEYWIQMQLQMEACNLDECDFLETRFVEYESFDAFNADGQFLLSERGEKKGVILYFSKPDGTPHYLYKPLHMDQLQFEKWEQEMISTHEDSMIWVKNIYWKLDEVNCVLVLRNERWFNDNITDISNIWDIIIQERENGFQHRAPTKKIKQSKATNRDDLEPNCCFIQINNNGKVTIDRTSRSNSIIDESHDHVITIRTESFDDTKQEMKKNCSQYDYEIDKIISAR